MSKKKTFSQSIQELTRVPLRDLKPIEVQHKKRKPMTVGRKMIIVVVILAVLLIVTVAIGRTWGPLNTISNTVFRPFETAFNAIGGWLEELRSNAKDNEALRAENDALKERVAQLEYEHTQNTLQLAKLAELQKLYELDTYYVGYPKVGAQIISHSSTNWVDSATIDKGVKDGLDSFMPILSEGGLYGHIDTAYDHYSKLVSILSEESSVSAEVFRSRDHVLVNGDYALKAQGLCKIEFDLGQVDIAEGDEIVTSKQSTVYPPGILIGKVLSVFKNDDGITGTATVEPYADVRNASYVLIITSLDPKQAEQAAP